MRKSNPFECDDQFIFDKSEVSRNHGKTALVHLAVGQGDIPESLDVILDHNPKFEDWLINTNRAAQMVPDHSIGLAWAEDGSKFSGSGLVVISKPRA